MPPGPNKAALAQQASNLRTYADIEAVARSDQDLICVA